MLVLLASTAFSIWAAGPGAAPIRLDPHWREAGAWRQAQGLPQDSVISLAQTSDGYIWVGTRAGLARFDGTRFTVFDDRNRDQLRENEIWALAEGDDGSLWIGTYGGGVSHYEDGRFTVYTTKEGLVDDYVRYMSRDAKGGIWVGTDHGVSCFRDGKITNYTIAEGLTNDGIRAVYADPQGEVWVVTRAEKDTFQRFKDGRFEVVTLPEPSPKRPIDNLCRDKNGALWIGALDGLYRWSGDTMTRFTEADGLSALHVRRLHEDPQGRLWIGTDVGFDRYVAGAGGAGKIQHEVDLPDLTAVFGDREGSLWVGFRGHGLARYHQGSFSSILPDTPFTTVLVDDVGTVWAGTATDLMALRSGRVEHYDREDGLSDLLQALAQDKEGRLWVGTENGLFRSKASVRCTAGPCPVSFEPIRAEAVPTIFARVIYPDRDGVVWIGTNLDGLLRWEKGKTTVVTTKDGLAHNAVRDITQDAEGALWIATKGGGLSRYKDGVFTTFAEKEVGSNSIQALYNDGDGVLWIATRHGLSRHKDGRFKNYTVHHGLYANHIYGFVEDERGTLWMACGKGIFTIPKSQLNDVADGKATSVTSTAYGLEHGLASTMASVGHVPVVARSAEGRIWFATLGGLPVVDPANLSTNPVPPPVHLEELRANQKIVDTSETVVLPPGRGDLTFRYAALSYLAPEKVRFRYKLEGFDPDWIDADTRRVAYYTNLPPGTFRFRVVACNNDGVWNETGAGVDLRLKPSFHQTSWFYAATILAIALAGAATQMIRVRQLRKNEAELKSRVDEAVAQIKVLRGLIPICASCKKIRDDSGFWSQMESYIHEHSEAAFSHGMCPECIERHYPEYAAEVLATPPKS